MKKKDKLFIFWICFIVSVIVTPYLAWGADASWVITAEGGIIYDSVTYEHYMGSDSTADSTGLWCTTCTGWTDTLTVSDSLYHFYYLYFYPVNDIHPSTWGWFKQPSGTTGVATSIVFPLRAYWTDSATASRTRRWSYNGTGITNSDVTTTSVDSNFHYVQNFSLSTSQLHNITVDLQYPGVDSGQTWGFQIQSASLKGGSGITLPLDDDLVNVYGWLRDARNKPIHGAKVVANRVTSRFGLGDSLGGAPYVIVPNTSVSTATDSLGLFQLIIRRTGSYRDTLSGKYNITATYRGSEMFSIEKLFVPNVDSLSLADSLAGR